MPGQPPTKATELPLAGFRYAWSNHGVMHILVSVQAGEHSVFQRPLCPSKARRALVGGVEDPSVRTSEGLQVARDTLGQFIDRACVRCAVRAFTLAQRGTINIDGDWFKVQP